MGYYDKHCNELVFLISALKKYGAKVNRDYHEISLLQSSERGVGSFANLCLNFVLGSLSKDIKKQYPDYSIMLNGKLLVNSQTSSKGFVLNFISGLSNFYSGLPFFSNSFSFVEFQDGKINRIIASAISLPALDMFFHAEIDQGAFLNNRRIRVSKKKNIADAMILIDNSEYSMGIFKKLKAKSNFISCADLSILFVARGISDACIFSKIETHEILGSLLILQESGGLMSEGKDLISLQKITKTMQKVICSNQVLSGLFRKI